VASQDNHLFALNYLHCGAAKVWYGVPAGSMAAMEEVWRDTFPHLLSR
jgi:histone demethylase JARID1